MKDFIWEVFHFSPTTSSNWSSIQRNHVTTDIFLSTILMIKQNLKLYSLLINMDERCNKFLSAFSLFNNEFSPGSKLIDAFSDHFSFYDQTCNIKGHLQNLDTITIDAFNNPHSSIIIVDTNIWNNVATSISHIYLHNSPVIKTIHQAVNTTTTESELFAIRCSINQIVGKSNINQIVVITDSLYVARKIFNSSLYPYQI